VNDFVEGELQKYKVEIENRFRGSEMRDFVFQRASMRPTQVRSYDNREEEEDEKPLSGRGVPKMTSFCELQQAGCYEGGCFSLVSDPLPSNRDKVTRVSKSHVKQYSSKMRFKSPFPHPE